MQLKQHRLTAWTTPDPDPDDICPKTGKRHAPDWYSAKVDHDGGTVYLDIHCRDCGRSGCLEAATVIEKQITW